MSVIRAAILAGVIVAGCSALSAATPSVQTTPIATSVGVSSGCGGEATAGDSGAAIPSPACSHPPSAPPGAISREAAISAARSAVGDTQAQADVIGADVGQNGFGAALPGHPWLWQVRLNGPALRLSPCPSGNLDREPDWSAAPCLDEEQGLWVVVDAFTGQVLGSMH